MVATVCCDTWSQHTEASSLFISPCYLYDTWAAVVAVAQLFLLTGAILLVDVSTMNIMELHFHVTGSPLWHSQALVAEIRAMQRDAACLTLI